MEEKNVKRLRLRLGLSQERFARLLGVSLQTVRRWETGISRPLPIISLRLDELEREARRTGLRTGGPGMTEEKRGSGEVVELGLGGLFKGIGGLFDLVSRMAEEGQGEEARSGEIDLGGKAKAVYGISVKLGLGGKPVIEQFGNVRATAAGPEVAEVREPLVDVMDEGERIVVIAELPGVEADDIQVEVKDDILSLSAEGKYRKYSKEVLLPAAVESESLERSYKNGILELKLGKRRGS
ncbi:MAG: archaeal heat shock protein Hsp20 [Dehalococcoidia bacterium]|nr:archaeal heat shock protein Hsp20 [Dehalococcoidia bacterium]